MHVIVVFESMFGNTERVARAVAEGLAPFAAVEVANVDEARGYEDADLLVVGGPTHAHGMSRAGTRSEAARETDGAVRSHTGLRDWIGALDHAPERMPVAAFDTRLAKPRWLTGSAAVSAERRLRALGFVPVVPPESFLVETDGTRTVLKDGERERARSWGAALGRRFATAML
ncbi:flavodoxin family protein [Amycolatopsis sp. TRM77291]|uniref:Flavodoxin n=1 Tax=Amycolatopsis keratiniphila subsp. keratiniphila TaxID=227715 RepID=A0A1W2M1A0_9PSEU|nr:flavodoxin domain-containing protein [Amycolatopsis keratiniphila]ONF73622.1 flavodoxin [Amycolatopsis keratiniphila subsp. keratiniphila]